MNPDTYVIMVGSNVHAIIEDERPASYFFLKLILVTIVNNVI